MPDDDLRPIQSINHAIKVLGGPTAMARLLGRTAQQVCQWRKRYGNIPPELFPLARTALKRQGYRAPFELFGFQFKVDELPKRRRVRRRRAG